MSVGYSDGFVRIGTCDRLVVGVWRAPFSHERLRALRDLVEALHARHGGGIGLLGVFESDAFELSAVSNEPLRRDAARLQADLADMVRGGQSVVFEGNGLAVSAFRRAALALQFLSRANERPVFHPDVQTSLAWLAERMKLGASARRDVERFVEELRAGGPDPEGLRRAERGRRGD